MSIKDYIIRFESLKNKIKKHGMDLPDGVLAYRFLHSANLKEEEMQLCRATIKEFKYKDMQQKVLSLYGDQVSCSSPSMKIKEEPVFYGNHAGYNEKTGYRGYRGGGNRGGSYRGSRGRGRGAGGGAGADRQNTRGREYQTPQKRPNPPGPNGYPSRCAVCSSIYHWAKYCPEIASTTTERKRTDQAINYTQNNDQDTDENNITLYEKSERMQQFVGETLGCAVVDSGCSKTVAGKEWVDCYLDLLNVDDKQKVTQRKSTEFFTFGKGSRTPSNGKIMLPAVIGNKDVIIETDVIDADIPMLLSKEALKKAKAILDFNNDTAIMFGVKITLIETDSGHYAIPLTITSDHNQHQQHITLVTSTATKIQDADSKKIADKLHRQFCHCSADRLSRLVRSSNMWGHDREKQIIESIIEVSNACNVCKRFKRAPAVPVVSLPLASDFNEVVAMDLIVLANGKYVLHLIDMFTRFSAACVRSSKKKDVIADAIMKIWISYFGRPSKFLADNGGEFANSEYSDMCEAFGINIMRTSAESPWSNGLCERHNGVLKESILKTIEDSKCSLDTAVAWAVSSKNSLHGNNGYSPNTLVFGRNPNYPSVITDQLPALTAKNLSHTVEENLKAFRSAREGFIKADSSERIKRALSHNVRSSSEAQFTNGENVFFKRNDSKRWHGPGKVIGQDGKQVFVRNGSEMIRVHTTRLISVTDNENAKITERLPEIEPEFHTSSEKVIIPEETQGNLIDSEGNDENDTIIHETQEHANNAEKVDDANNQEISNSSKVYPKINTNILYRLPGSNEWLRGYVDNRAGSIRSKSGFWRRVCNLDNAEKIWYDFSSDVDEWETVPSDVLVINNDNESIMIAKQKEIENRKRNQVYEEVPNQNQHAISTRWVMTTKDKEGVFVTKARLCARGFEDDAIMKENVDSPTCSKETIRISLTIMSMQGWNVKSLDVKTAFLQGNPLKRDIFIKPPREAKTENLWKLRKAVYGLNEASRYWFNRVKDELTQLGIIQSKYDEALFYYKNEGKLQGIIPIHVDDFLFGGTN